MTDKRHLLTAISTVAAASLSLSAMASQNTGTDLFEANELPGGFMTASVGFVEGGCGEGSCGEDHKDKDKDKDKDEEGSCGEGSCGEDKDKDEEGSCGEGSCGEEDKDEEGSCGS